MENNKCDFEISIAPKAQLLPTALAAFNTYALSLFPDNHERGRLVAAIEEAVNNVLFISSSNRLEQIIIRAYRLENSLRIEVHDKGLPGEYSDELSESQKFGLELMEKFVDEVHVINLGQGGRCQELIKYFKTEQSDSALAEAKAENAEAQPADLDMNIRFDELTREDAIKFSRGIFEEYGYTYGKEFVYYPDQLLEHAKDENYHFSVLKNGKNELVGCMAHCARTDLPGYWEGGMVVIDKNYRGCGLMQKMVSHSENFIVKNRNAKVEIGTAVTSHPYSQKAGINMGSAVNGFLFNFLPPTTTVSTFTSFGGRSSYVSLYRPLTKRPESRKVFLAEELQKKPVENIYHFKNLKRDFVSSDNGFETEKSELSSEYQNLWEFGAIIASSIGSDFAKQLHNHTVDIKKKNAVTVQLYIPIEKSGAIYAYEAAKKEGYFFTMLYPDTDNGDIMIMQKLFLGTIDYDSIIVVPEGLELFNFVKSLDPDNTVL